MFFRLYLPPGSGHLRHPATIDPTLALCIRDPLRMGGLRQCGIWSLPNTSTHGQHWESNPRPSDHESNALSTGPHAAHYLAAVITYLGPNHIVNTSPYCSLGRKKSKCTFSGRLNIEPTTGQRVGPGGRRGAYTCKMIIFLWHLWTLYKRLSHMKSPLYCSSGYNYKSPWWLNCPGHLSLNFSWVEFWVHVHQSQIWLKL